MTLQLTTYRVERDHSNETRTFRVEVPEAGHTGYGFQVRIGKSVYGVSLIRVTR